MMKACNIIYKAFVLCFFITTSCITDAQLLFDDKVGDDGQDFFMRVEPVVQKGRVRNDQEGDIQTNFFLSINESNTVYTVFDGLEMSEPDTSEARLVTFKDFQKTLNIILRQEGSNLTQEARSLFHEGINQTVFDHIDEQIYEYENRKGGQLMNYYNQKSMNKTQRVVQNIINKNMKEFDTEFRKLMVQIIADLQKRFQLQMKENNNQPLEINRELDRSLQMLLTIVFETEVEQKQFSVFDKIEQMIIQQSKSYVRWNVLKAVNLKQPLEQDQSPNHHNNMEQSTLVEDGDAELPRETILMGSPEDMEFVNHYIPKDSDIFFQMSDGSKKRLIFGEPMEYSEVEEAIWDIFLNYIENTNQMTLPQQILDDPNRMGQRYLHGTDFNFKQAYQILMWRQKEIFDEDQSQFQQFLDEGAFYISGRLDKAGLQPVIVIDVKKFVDMQMDVDELESSLKFIFHYCETKLYSSGHVEQFFIILDLNGVGVFDIPVKKMKPLVDILSKQFKGQMYRLVSCNTGALMRSIFSIVQLWLSEFEQQSMILCAEGDCLEELTKYMSIDKIEHRFGGTRPNIIKYFPPRY